MAKGKKSIFFCQNCGHEEAKWLGQCPACKEWNTFVEERIDSGITKGTTVAARAVHEAKVVPLTEVTADDDTRSETGSKSWTGFSEAGLYRDHWYWSEAIRELESQHFYYRYVKEWHR